VRLRYEAAFCHLVYRAPNGEELRIWNGRDGPVPNRLLLPSGIEADLVMGPTLRAPAYVPEVGERIFVSLHPERAVYIAAAKVEEFWGDKVHPLAALYASKDDAVEALARVGFGQGNAPDLIEVTPFLRAKYLRGGADVAPSGFLPSN
jgi:hypothetical protein